MLRSFRRISPCFRLRRFPSGKLTPSPHICRGLPTIALLLMCDCAEPQLSDRFHPSCSLRWSMASAAASDSNAEFGQEYCCVDACFRITRTSPWPTMSAMNFSTRPSRNSMVSRRAFGRKRFRCQPKVPMVSGRSLTSSRCVERRSAQRVALGSSALEQGVGAARMSGGRG